jgi:hypothetical protein
MLLPAFFSTVMLLQKGRTISTTKTFPLWRANHHENTSDDTMSTTDTLKHDNSREANVAETPGAGKHIKKSTYETSL